MQPTLIVELSDGTHSGYGEATTNSYYGATLEQMVAALETVRPEIERSKLDDPPTLWQALQPSWVIIRLRNAH